MARHRRRLNVQFDEKAFGYAWYEVAPQVASVEPAPRKLLATNIQAKAAACTRARALFGGRRVIQAHCAWFQLRCSMSGVDLCCERARVWCRDQLGTAWAVSTCWEGGVH